MWKSVWKRSSACRSAPVTGIPLPFVTVGGSSMVANWVVIGLLLRISDHARRPVSERRQDQTGNGARPRSRAQEAP